MEAGGTTTDANHLHLKKKLTRIRKVSPAVKDPGTSCISKLQNRNASSSGGLIDAIVTDNANTDATVLLHNWRHQESENVTARQSSEENVDKDGGNGHHDEHDGSSIQSLKASDFSLMMISPYEYDTCEHQSFYPQTQRSDDYNSEEDLSQESEASPLLPWPPSKLVMNRRKDRVGHVSSSSNDSSKSIQSLSHKYLPKSFSDLIGQGMVVQSLMSAIERRRIAPLHLFHGPHGTGKTSTARIFAAALNFLPAGEAGEGGECKDYTGKRHCVVEIDGSDKAGLNKIKHFVGSLSSTPPSRYNVFIVDECRSLLPKMWREFLQLLRKPMPGAVFILTTAHINSVPSAVLSRCRKHLFNRIKNVDIIVRLMRILDEEKMEVEFDALELIASRADGSLHDAETMVDQLSLLGGKITKSLVNDFMGVVPDDKLLELLELAMSSRATETVIRSRELMDSGVDPLVLMSQMVALIIDIIGGTCLSVSSNRRYSFSGERLSKKDINKLKRALVLLSQAEKQHSIPRDHATWFTATLLQLDNASSHSPACSRSLSSSIAAVEDRQRATDEAFSGEQRRSDGHPLPDAARKENVAITHNGSNTLHEIWLQCIEECYPETLQQLLHSHGRLVSISETEGSFVAHIAFSDMDIKTRAEGFLFSIMSSFEAVLKRDVEVKIALLESSSGNEEMLPSKHQPDAKVKIALLEGSSGNGEMLPSKHQPDATRSAFDAFIIDQIQPQPVGENAEIVDQMQQEENGLNLTPKQDRDQLSHDTQVPTAKNSMQQHKGKIAKKTDHKLTHLPSMCGSSSRTGTGSHIVQRHRRHMSGLEGGGGRQSSQTAVVRFPNAEVVGSRGGHGCKCSCFRCFDKHKTN